MIWVRIALKKTVKNPDRYYLQSFFGDKAIPTSDKNNGGGQIDQSEKIGAGEQILRTFARCQVGQSFRSSTTATAANWPWWRVPLLRRCPPSVARLSSVERVNAR